MDVHSCKVCKMNSLAKSAIRFDGEEFLACIQVKQTLTFRLFGLILVNIQILLQ